MAGLISSYQIHPMFRSEISLVWPLMCANLTLRGHLMAGRTGWRPTAALQAARGAIWPLKAILFWRSARDRKTRLTLSLWGRVLCRKAVILTFPGMFAAWSFTGLKTAASGHNAKKPLEITFLCAT